ncbi:pescadillo [Anaeramoeba ignava]|uniref:Pescadillo n=1 Tax=Anaeramoeba ignava TaxID=1746090 RepID=A0A9Q0R8B8_ANAIG|nr:pescadillo [Anaeramoeba ignava]
MGRRKQKKPVIESKYLTRGQALRKLQLSLTEFRRLCILKGIFPRQPKKKGSGKVYYSIKDIKFLSHEPIIKKFREFNSFYKKIKKAIGKKEFQKIKSMESNLPTYTLHHIVKERYPTFIDALRDLDDCITLISLFAILPSSSMVPANRTQNCQKLYCEFLNYIIKTHSLRKVFVSIKGIYFQVEIKSQLITWITPHQFTQHPPKNIDFRVMLTFLELYEAILKFVNHELFYSINLRYPPEFDQEKLSNGDLLGALILLNENENQNQNENENQNQNEIENENENQIENQKLMRERIKTLEQKLISVEKNEAINVQNEEKNQKENQGLDQEVEQNFSKKWKKMKMNQQENNTNKHKNKERKRFQRLPLEFVIRSFGGKVGWQGEGSEFGKMMKNNTSNCGSVNELILLPVEDYAPEVKPPSPFISFVKDHIVENQIRNKQPKTSVLIKMMRKTQLAKAVMTRKQRIAFNKAQRISSKTKFY